ncbi:MAG: HAD-IA family hydrolase [Oscillospiraceae bacterium]|jgi:phosphoglycolate phosphatase|nr:HAD-IA family hydrolase [Oscillospiraceae bacterium]
MKKYAAVLFDFDGTFADSSEGILASANEAFAALGYPAWEMPAFRRFLGPSLQDSMMRFAGMSPEEAQRAIAIYRASYVAGNCLRLRIFDGMEELLRRLTAENIPVAIASSKITTYLEKILQSVGYRHYFTAVVGAEPTSMENDKTHLLQKAAADCGAAPEDCLMVGDRYFDMEAAKALGMQAAGVLYGFGEKEELLAAGADFLAASCKELEAVIFGGG